MKCRKCGHIVNENESKCRYCGARIIRKPLASARRARKEEGAEEEYRPILKKVTGEDFERETFSWDTHDFPSEHKRTKNMDFDWATFDAFHTNKKEAPQTATVHHDGDEVALLSKEEVKAAEAGTSESSVPTDVTPEEPATTQEPVQEQNPVEAISEEALPEEETLAEPDEPAYEERTTTVAKNPLDELMQLEKDTEEKKESEVEEFYTFHKKNAEFQELLDREYEKYRSGRISPATERMEDAMDDARGNEEELFASEEKEPETEAVTIPPVAGLEEEVVVKPETEPEAQETLEEPNESTEGTESEPKETGEETKDPETEEQEPVSEDVKEDVAEGEKTPEKRKIRGWIVALIVIVVLVALMAGIVKFAPESGLGRLLGVAQTEQNKPVAEQEDREEAATDKTGLIQREIDRDKDGALGDVYYDADLKFDKADRVKDKDIAESETLSDNKVLGTHNGKKEYLDEAIVGAVIKEVASDANSEKPTLAIGEIRKGEKDYYVWIEENGSKKICTVEVAGDTPKVVKTQSLK